MQPVCTALRPAAAAEQARAGRASARRALLRRSARAEHRSAEARALWVLAARPATRLARNGPPSHASGTTELPAAAPLRGRRHAVSALSALGVGALLAAAPRVIGAEADPYATDDDDAPGAADASPAQREAAARLAANLAAKTAKRGGLARAVADGLAEPQSTSPLELGTALVTAAWVAGFAVVAALVQQRRTQGGGGDDAS